MGEEVAEREGFEPSDPHYQVNSLAVSPIRPLWHLSVTHHCRASRFTSVISCTKIRELWLTELQHERSTTTPWPLN